MQKEHFCVSNKTKKSLYGGRNYCNPGNIPHICHIVHMLDMWRKICHVEKFQISIHGKWGEI